MSARSGDFSQDPAFDPEQLFQVIGHEENTERVSEAMRVFLVRQDVPAFEQAVAIFIRSARARSEPVERVLAVLIELTEEREGVRHPHDRSVTDMRRLVLRAVLVAFYGETASRAPAPGGERRRGGSERQRVDGHAPTGEQEHA